MELALQFSASDAGTVRTFVNGGSTPEGGTHFDGLIAGLTRWVACQEEGMGPRRVEALLKGLTAVISVHLHSPDYPGPTKNRIANPEIFALVDEMVYDGLNALAITDPNFTNKTFATL